MVGLLYIGGKVVDQIGDVLLGVYIMEKRITIRFNEQETATLDLYKATFNIDDDSKAIKSAISWVVHYLKNVTNTFFPPDYDVVLIKKKKTEQLNRKVY